MRAAVLLFAVIVASCATNPTVPGPQAEPSDIVATVTTPSSPEDSAQPSVPLDAGTPSESVTTLQNAPPLLDWSKVTWFTHHSDGIHTNDGLLIWPTNPILGDDNIHRDGQGGFVFLEVEKVWWWPYNASQPVLVSTESAWRITRVIQSPNGPIVRLESDSPTFLRLVDGLVVDAPVGEEAHPTPYWLRELTATNGFSALITQPVTVTDGEGFPGDVIEPAHLVIKDGKETLLDIRVGSWYQPYTIIHDFDGRRIIISRGPYEPALPVERYFVLDLGCGRCIHTFEAGGTNAVLAGLDVTWDGPIEVPGIPTPLETDEGVTSLVDGRYVVFIDHLTEDASELSADLALWFSGEEANKAASDDGETDLPVPNDYYIRNLDNQLLNIPVSADVTITSVWFNYDETRELESTPITYAELLAALEGAPQGSRQNMAANPWWITVEDGLITALDEQYIP